MTCIGVKPPGGPAAIYQRRLSCSEHSAHIDIGPVPPSYVTGYYFTTAARVAGSPIPRLGMSRQLSPRQEPHQTQELTRHEPEMTWGQTLMLWVHTHVVCRLATAGPNPVARNTWCDPLAALSSDGTKLVPEEVSRLVAGCLPG